MQPMTKQASSRRPVSPMMMPMVLVAPMAPSPMMTRVKSPMRSVRCVCLKLRLFQMDDSPRVMPISIRRMMYQT